MNAVSAVNLMRKYNNCPKCGSDKVGHSEGTLEITDEVFRRTCKCGWGIEVKEK
jgi:transcription elongation factor Elf1